MSLEKNVEEELFCLKFELDSLSQHIVYGNHERWLYKFMSPYGEKLHLNRYYFAKKFTENKVVLDIAGGCGYGTYLLATEGNPKEIHSVDLSESSVRYANYRYSHPKIKRTVADAETYVIKQFFDTIISFETVEHLERYNAFLDNVYQSLKPDGIFIISTPVTQKTSKDNLNPYHVIEWSFNDFQKLIETKFKIKECYIQNITLKHQIVKSFYSRVMYKLNPNKYKTFDPLLIKYTKQINPENIVTGFQVIVCTK